MQKAKRYAIIVGIVVGILLIAGIILAAIFNVWLTILYIALIILAAFTLLAVAFQIYAVLMLIRSITTVRDEMKPLIASVQQTAGQTASTIGSTAKLTQEFAVRPTIRVVAGLVAARQVLGILTGGRRAESQRERRRQQQMEAIEAANAVANAGTGIVAGGGE